MPKGMGRNGSEDKMARRRRATGRFYVFLLILAAIAFLILRPYLNFGSKEAVIMTASSEYSQRMDCVVIRDETVVAIDSTSRIEYIASEDTLVNAGDVVAYVYTAGYTESLLKKLEETRSNIQDYHKTAILNNIKDSNLDRYDTIVSMMVSELKDLINHETRGSILTAAQQLETAMVNRQEYLRQNKREDTKLAKLYDEENTRLTSIRAWRKEETAKSSGVVSFYMDGYEGILNKDQLDTLTPATVQAVLAGNGAAKTNSKSTSVYRLVDQDTWYVAILANTDNWNPVVDQEYYLQIEGYEDLSFTAAVKSAQKANGTLMVIFEINDPMGPLIYKRAGRATLTTTISGLSVTSKALYEQNGQTGVWLYDVPGGTFVPVEVLSDDGRTALIQPVVAGSIDIGSRVLIK